MTWTTADFRSYPSRFPRALCEAAALSGSELHLGGFPSRSAAESEALRHRKYRYLIRSHPGVDTSLDAILTFYQFRTAIRKEPLGVFALYLKAKPLIHNLANLNPHLADILSAPGQ